MAPRVSSTCYVNRQFAVLGLAKREQLDKCLARTRQAALCDPAATDRRRFARLDSREAGRADVRLSNVSQAMSAPRARQGHRGPAPWRLRRTGLLLWIRCRRRRELSAGGDAELAVDVARVGTNRLYPDPQGDRYLSVRATLLEQG